MSCFISGYVCRSSNATKRAAVNRESNQKWRKRAKLFTMWRISLVGDDFAEESYLNSNNFTRLENADVTFYRPFNVVREYDWKDHLGSLFSSQIFQEIREQWFVNAFVATTAALLDYLHPFPAISVIPHELVGTALGLLLVFRTEKAYDRFWEGRTRWSNLMRTMRELTQHVTVHIEDEESAEDILRLAEAYPYAVKDHIRARGEAEPFDAILKPEEMKLFASSSVNRPAVILALLAEALRSSDPKQRHQNFNEKIMSELYSVLSGCEKIAKTPVPLSYARHTSRFLTLWTLTLPIVMVDSLHFLVIPVAAIISWALLCIKRLAEKMERPFELQKRDSGAPSRSQLPIDDTCLQITLDIDEVQNMRKFIRDSRKPQKNPVV